MKIFIGADHAGYQLKDEIAATLRAAGHEVTDVGTNGPDSVDYPDF
ncbi:MAG: RpiB/LacA/LacB family sugar-phosphate isomerase, partial [Bryobacteraceae bacterium]